MIVLTEIELETLISSSFTEGVNSYNNWKGQRDTCWSNVEQDRKEFVENKLNEIKKNNNNG